MSEELKIDRYDVTEGGGTFKCPGGELVYYDDVHKLIAENESLRTQLASTGGEAVEVVGYGSAGQIEVLKQLPLTGGMKVSGREREKYNVPLMTVAQLNRIVAAMQPAPAGVVDWHSAVRELFDAKQELRDFESENPGDSTSRWESRLNRVEAAEAELRALLNQAGGE